MFGAVIEGMRRVTRDPSGGTAYAYLGDYPIEIAAKTGTPETKQFPNSVFICFAPVEEPEICVTIIVEGAGSGGDYAVPIARRIFDAYFGGGS